MNRNLRDSLAGGRSIPAMSQFRRGNNNVSQNGFTRDSDENLDLFSKIRRSFPLASSDELPDVSSKLGRLSVGSKPAYRGKGDDLLSAEAGKNDYDWLLTPPGTPLGSESHSSLAAPKITSAPRASSASKASRLSVSQSESSYHSSRPARSSSVTRPSISTSQFSSFTSNRSPSSILNTSSASVSSYIRPSSPSSRSTSSARPSTPTRTSSSSRGSTPSRIRPGSSSSSMDNKARPSLSSRPSTPTSRPQQLSANSSNTIASRPNSRPSTPTRRSPSTSVSATSGSNISGGRAASNGRSTPSLSRPSSPGTRAARTTPQQPIVLADFPHDTPPNLRTSLPDRPISAGRSRPVSGSSTAKASPEPKGPLTRRNSSPVVTRGRVTETQGKGRYGGNGQQQLTDTPEPRRISNVSDITSRRTLKTSSSASDINNGIGRSFSKSSLDMAIRHMDIRNGKSNGCALSATTLFPQSIRQGSSKIQPIRSGNNLSDSMSSNSGENNGNEANEGRRMLGKLSDMDMYESSRYDALLLKEDVKNTNWLHSIDDRSSDHGLMFDNGGFELLPEPFAPL